MVAFTAILFVGLFLTCIGWGLREEAIIESYDYR